MNTTTTYEKYKFYVRQSVPVQQPAPQRQEMDGPSGLDDIINQMNLKPEDIPDLDNVSL